MDEEVESEGAIDMEIPCGPACGLELEAEWGILIPPRFIPCGPLFIRPPLPPLVGGNEPWRMPAGPPPPSWGGIPTIPGD